MNEPTAGRVEGSRRRLQVGLGDLSLWVVGAAAFFALARGARGFWMDWATPTRPMLDIDRAVGVALLAPATLIGSRLLLDAIRPVGGRGGRAFAAAWRLAGVAFLAGMALLMSMEAHTDTVNVSAPVFDRSRWRVKLPAGAGDRDDRALAGPDPPAAPAGGEPGPTMGRAVGDPGGPDGSRPDGVLVRLGDLLSHHHRARRGEARDGPVGPVCGRLPIRSSRPGDPPRSGALAVAGSAARDRRALGGRRARRLRARRPLAGARPPGTGRGPGSAPVVARRALSGRDRRRGLGDGGLPALRCPAGVARAPGRGALVDPRPDPVAGDRRDLRRAGRRALGPGRRRPGRSRSSPDPRAHRPGRHGRGGWSSAWPGSPSPPGW